MLATAEPQRWDTRHVLLALFAEEVLGTVARSTDYRAIQRAGDPPTTASAGPAP